MFTDPLGIYALKIHLLMSARKPVPVDKSLGWMTQYLIDPKKIDLIKDFWVQQREQNLGNLRYLEELTENEI